MRRIDSIPLSHLVFIVHRQPAVGLLSSQDMLFQRVRRCRFRRTPVCILFTFPYYVELLTIHQSIAIRDTSRPGLPNSGPSDGSLRALSSLRRWVKISSSSRLCICRSTMVCPLPLSSFLSLTSKLGPGTCPGRALAMHEMRAVLFSLLRRFDFRFAEGGSTETWFRDLRDHYTYLKGKLEVQLEERW
jgi:hypothetical protein